MQQQEQARDLYLNSLTDEQAGRAMRQMADLLLNGGDYEPVGHPDADSMCADLLGVTSAATSAAAKADAGTDATVLGEGLRRSVAMYPRED